MTSVSTDRRFGVNAGMAIKVPCKVATTANITLSGEQTIDGVACVEDDRVLVRTQTTASENGIYYVKSSAWERTPDFDDPKDVSEGTLISINQGSTYTEAVFRVDTTGTITPGTTSITFTLSSFFADRQAPVSNIASLRAVDISGLSSGTVVYVISHTSYGDGGHGDFRLVTGAAAGTYVDNGGTIIVPTGGNGSAAFLREIDLEISVSMFGASPSNSAAVNVAAIQAAIDYASTVSLKEVSVSGGTYLINKQGTIDGRDYGLELKTGVTLKGAGAFVTTIKAADSSNIDVITSSRLTHSSKISIIGMTVDGNQANQTSGGFNIWMYDIDYLHIDDVMSKDSSSWGIRPDLCTNISIGTVYVDHSAHLSADGIHFKDCRNVVLDKAIIKTLGDDGFIIEAASMDVYNYSIGELFVTCPVTTAAAGRGILLLLDETVAAANYFIHDVQIGNAVTYNCKGDGVSVAGPSLANVVINCVDFGSSYGASVTAGSVSYAASITDCKFNIVSRVSTAGSFVSSLLNGTITRCELNLKSYDPADGYVACVILGSHWDANIDINYDPTGTKVSESYGVDVYANDSIFKISSDGALYNINLRATAADNTFHLGTLSGAVTYDIYTNAGANNNKFIGGKLSGAIVNSGTGNKFIGVTGGDNYGNVTITPDGSGNGTIAHGLKLQPSYCSVEIRGTNSYEAFVQTVDATNITVLILNTTTGAAVVAGSYVIDWEARI